MLEQHTVCWTSTQDAYARRQHLLGDRRWQEKLRRIGWNWCGTSLRIWFWVEAPCVWAKLSGGGRPAGRTGPDSHFSHHLIILLSTNKGGGAAGERWGVAPHPLLLLLPTPTHLHTPQQSGIQEKSCKWEKRLSSLRLWDFDNHHIWVFLLVLVAKKMLVCDICYLKMLLMFFWCWFIFYYKHFFFLPVSFNRFHGYSCWLTFTLTSKKTN